MCVLTFAPQLYGQNTEQNPVLADTLSEIRIEALRLDAVSSSAAPLAVAVRGRSIEQRALEPALSLDEALRTLPGIWINDRANAALGERISIRGMGWRSAFGVRGVQVLLDGIPLTMPDGQAFADIVAPSMIDRAELIRGPASLFWGNASGGVVYLSTKQPVNASPGRLRIMGGSDGLRAIEAEGYARAGVNQFHVFVNNDQRDGYRDYSASRFTRAALHGTLPLNNQTVVRIMGALADQDAENPGSLTVEQMNEDPRMANTRNVDTRAGKESFQAQLGATLLTQTNAGALSATAYGIVRDLDNPLSFTYIDLNRLAGGLRIALQNSSENIDWGAGVDFGFQSDDRRNVNNQDGNPGQEEALAQDESVRNIAGYGFLNITIAGPLRATAGLRLDGIRFSMDDRFFENGDQSGNRNFSAVSPAIGLSYQLTNGLLYANFRNAFETPTTTELVNRPDLDGGFNPDLDPQRVSSFEVGVRGMLANSMIEYDVALYSMEIKDKLSPFQTEAGGDRTFFRNSGENQHQGVELAVNIQPSPAFSGQFIRMSNLFELKDEGLDGNRLPGIPDHRTILSGRYSGASFWAQVQFEHATSYYVNDANTQKNDGYAVLDLFVGHPGIDLKSVQLLPFVRISNLFDEAYNGSVVINAFGGRFFEPAAGRTIQAGLNVTL